MNDLRHADPRREKVDEQTVVFDDVTEALFEYNKDLQRFIETAESRFATLTIKSAQELKRMVDLHILRVKHERHRLNKEYEREKEERKKRLTGLVD